MFKKYRRFFNSIMSLLVYIILLPYVLSSTSSGDDEEKCPGIYKRFSAEHTFCLSANDSCSIITRGVTDTEKEFILQLHNEYRSKVATGQEDEAGGMPSASNMLEMIWDDELALLAQKLAETCRYGHDCSNCRRVQSFSVGQNIGMISNIVTPPLNADWHIFIKSMYDEVSRFDKKYISPFIPGPDDEDTQYGHFTQMLWATSWKIGCGWALFKDEETYASYTVCNYGPGGNIREGEMYKVGSNCSACPGNTCCGNACEEKGINITYSGLCKVIVPFMSPEGPGPHDEDYVFYCDFSNQPDCAVTFEGKPWMLIRTPGGNWMSNVLKGGENVRLMFNRTFEVTQKFCLKLLIRSGPNIDGEADSGEGQSTLKSGLNVVKYDLKNKKVPKNTRQSFMKHIYGLTLPGGKFEFQYSFNYYVPPESPSQFVEIKEVSVKKC